ncbi:hypothetical protein JHK87_027403 [Glycine soja]|nr:hypothetical protein JHK87_027403 [Glycine soja]
MSFQMPPSLKHFDQLNSQYYLMVSFLTFELSGEEFISIKRNGVDWIIICSNIGIHFNMWHYTLNPWRATFANFTGGRTYCDHVHFHVQFCKRETRVGPGFVSGMDWMGICLDCTIAILVCHLRDLFYNQQVCPTCRQEATGTKVEATSLFENFHQLKSRCWVLKWVAFAEAFPVALDACFENLKRLNDVIVKANYFNFPPARAMHKKQLKPSYDAKSEAAQLVNGCNGYSVYSGPAPVSGYSSEEAERYWFAFILYSLKKLIQKNEKGGKEDIENTGLCFLADTLSVTYHIPTLNTKDAKKVLTQGSVNPKAFKSTMIWAWKAKGDVEAQDVEKKLFTFRIFQKKDIDIIMKLAY